MWDAVFENLLRSKLPGLPAHEPLAPDTPLPALGLNSMAMVALAAALEDAYGVTIPDSALVPLSFRTPQTVWSTLCAVRAPHEAGL